MNIMTAEHSYLLRQSRTDDALTARIAEMMAEEHQDEVCRFYVNLADEIMAMVRESDRELRRGEAR